MTTYYRTIGSTIFLIGICLIVLYTPTYAQNRISPFANLEWEDSIDNVNKKLQNMEGIEKIALVFRANHRVRIPLDSKSNMGTAISALFRKSKKGMLLNANDSRVKNLLRKFLDHQGQEKNYIPNAFQIIASPIAISGVPYELQATFSVNHGVAVVRPDNVIVANNGKYFYALTLIRVELVSNAPGIKESTKAIRAALKSKYKKFYLEEARIYVDKNADIEINRNEFSSTVIYKEFGYSKMLKQSYNKHLAKIQSNKLKGKGDAASKL